MQKATIMLEKKEQSQAPELVKFEEVHCCALRHAFANSSNIDVVASLVKAIGEEKVKLSAEILNKTFRLGFPHNPEIDEIYYEIAAAELERLEKIKEGEANFSCGHSAEEHKEALLSIIAMTAPKSIN